MWSQKSPEAVSEVLGHALLPPCETICHPSPLPLHFLDPLLLLGYLTSSIHALPPTLSICIVVYHQALPLKVPFHLTLNLHPFSLTHSVFLNLFLRVHFAPNFHFHLIHLAHKCYSPPGCLVNYATPPITILVHLSLPSHPLRIP